MSQATGKRIRQIIERISQIGSVVSATTIVIMMCLTVVDVTLRKLGGGIPGCAELNALLMVVVIFPALAHCWNLDGHIRVDLFVDRFSVNIQTVANAFAAVIGLCFFGAIFWGSIGFTTKAIRMKELSTTLKLPLFPVKLFVVIGCAIFCFQLLVSAIDLLHRVLKNPDPLAKEK